MRMLLLILFLTLLPQLAVAENTQAAPEAAPVVKGDFTAMKHVSSNRVDKVIDAQTVLMKDGKIVRLLSIDYPAASGDDISEPAIAAKARLDKLLPETTEVMLFQKRNRMADDKSGRSNRMGHVLAHLVIKVKDNEEGEWINGALVAEGLAWASTDASNPEMAQQLYALEQKARDGGKGLWAKNSAFGLLTPETAGEGDGQFRIVEGTVNRAASSKNNLYLNFGTDMKKDFTVMIPAGQRRQYARLGIDPMALSGQKIRVRGWIRSWNGPFMELETPERLEIVAASRPSTETPPEPSTDAVEKSAPTL